MFNQNGLSLDQAPPISVVLRFFFGGSLFGLLAGVVLLVYGEKIFDSSTSEALIFTHLLTLGVMLSFMFGALFQMLPVIAGVTLTSPVPKANFVQYPLSVGIFFLLSAFGFGYPWLYVGASILLGMTLLSIVFIMLQSLVKLLSHSASSKGMIFALLSLGILVILALYLSGTLSGYLEGTYYRQVKNAHYSFGLFGWIALLIMAISFQVIEMFYVTPPYPKYLSRYLVVVVFLTLLTHLAAEFFMPSLVFKMQSLLALELIVYAFFTLLRLSQRKRSISDATIWFWRLGMGSLMMSMTGKIMMLWLPNVLMTYLTFIFFITFALSIVFGMVYKIVPFLTWFHLNSQGYFTAPMMHEIIHPKTAKKHFWIHFATLISAIIALFVPQALLFTGGFLILSFGWMSYQIIHAHLLYTKTQREGERFDMRM